MRTIGAAVALAQAQNAKNIGTKIIVDPGIYREFVDVRASWKSTKAPMEFEASVPGTAIIAGSDVLTNWMPDTAHPGAWIHPWNYTLATCPVPSGWPSDLAPVALRTEMVFVNSNPLAQVMSLADMRAGTFFIDDNANAIHMWPPSSVNMQWAVVEAAARPQTLYVNGISNLTISGLVFRHAANCMNTSGAMVNNANNVLVDNVQAVWNNWGGLGISHSNQFTVQNSVASHNGGVGFSASTNTNVLYENNESDYNNWRGAMGALYDWGMGGIKLMLTHGAKVANHTSYNNQAQGLWFDTDNKNIDIDNATLSGNVMGSFQMEANEGPISIANSTVCSSGIGINVINTADLTVKNSFFFDNSGTNKYQAEIFIAGKPDGRAINDWETGQPYLLFTTNTILSGNTFADAEPGQYTLGTYLSGSDWTQFANTLSTTDNDWFDPHTAASFKIPGFKGQPTNFTGWESTVHKDTGSSWKLPTAVPGSCTAPLDAFTDFHADIDSRSYTMTGGQATITLQLYSYGYGPVRLQLSELPPGVTGAFSQSILTSGTATLTLTASPTAPVQTTFFTIWAYSGARVHPITVEVNVLPAPSK